MPRSTKLLNVRKHLEHGRQIVEGIRKYGMCPVVMHDIAEFNVINEAILQSHKSRGTRKDIRIEEQLKTII